MSRRATPTIALALAACAIAGCQTNLPGTPQPGSTTTGTTGALPPRPQSLPLNGRDPCALLTSDQRESLSVGSGRPGTAGGGSPACNWSHFPDEPRDSYFLQFDTGRGAEYALASTTGARVVDIEGFAAVETQRGGSYPEERHCVLLVDVADGQNLWVQYEYNGSTVQVTRELACEKALSAAGMAVQTLREQAGG
jgi:uncharacterized protein DUF3558